MKTRTVFAITGVLVLLLAVAIYWTLKDGGVI